MWWWGVNSLAAPDFQKYFQISPTKKFVAIFFSPPFPPALGWKIIIYSSTRTHTHSITNDIMVSIAPLLILTTALYSSHCLVYGDAVKFGDWSKTDEYSEFTVTASD